jgi:hypothetical protein
LKQGFRRRKFRGQSTRSGLLDFRRRRAFSPTSETHFPRHLFSRLGIFSWTKNAYDVSVSPTHKTGSKINRRLVVVSQFRISSQQKSCETLRYLSLETQAQGMTAVEIDYVPRVALPFISLCLPYVLFLSLDLFHSTRQLEHSFLPSKSKVTCCWSALDFPRSLLHIF